LYSCPHATARVFGENRTTRQEHSICQRKKLLKNAPILVGAFYLRHKNDVFTFTSIRVLATYAKQLIAKCIITPFHSDSYYHFQHDRSCIPVAGASAGLASFRSEERRVGNIYVL